MTPIKSNYYKSNLSGGFVFILELNGNSEFARCVDVLARLIEKYGNEENSTYSEKS